MEHLDWLASGDRRLEDLADAFGLQYRSGDTLWTLDRELAFPCATQNGLKDKDARALVDGGCEWVIEGANMPCDSDALRVFDQAGTIVCPGKAANAGGVAVSALVWPSSMTRRSRTMKARSQ